MYESSLNTVNRESNLFNPEFLEIPVFFPMAAKGR